MSQGASQAPERRPLPLSQYHHGCDCRRSLSRSLWPVAAYSFGFLQPALCLGLMRPREAPSDHPKEVSAIAAFLIADIDITDPTTYEDYKRQVAPLIARKGRGSPFNSRKRRAGPDPLSTPRPRARAGLTHANQR